MNTKEDIMAQVQLKLLEGYAISVVSYWTFSRESDRLRYLICYYRCTKTEKSILVRKVSRRNAMFVTADMRDLGGVKSSKLQTPAVDLVFRYGSNPNWETYRIPFTVPYNVSE